MAARDRMTGLHNRLLSAPCERTVFQWVRTPPGNFRCSGSWNSSAAPSIGPAVHPREVVKLVLECQAASVLLVHNRPSLTDEVSSADELISKRLVEALSLIDARVCDHRIVAGG